MPPRRQTRAGAVLALGLALFACAPVPGLPSGTPGDRAAETGAGSLSLARFSLDVVRTDTNPLHWRSDSLVKLTAVLGAGLAAFAAEEGVRDWAVRNRDTGAAKTLVQFRHLGNGFAALGIGGGMLLGGEVFGKPGLTRTGFLALEAYVAGAILDGAGKFFFGRARPYTDEGHATFHPFTFLSRHSSLPSGHATTAFSLATVIAERTRGVVADVACYGVATLVAWSRVQGDVHWLSDVVLGSALGYFVGKKICDLDRAEAGVRVRASVGPAPGGGMAGTLSISF